MKRTLPLLLAGLALAPLTLAALSAAESKKKAPARSLDIGLLKQAPKIIDFLDRQKHDTIGVLPFEVQKGKGKPSFDAAPLAASLPGRLENALITSMEPDETKALRVLREPAAYAASQKIGAWTKDRKAFDRLFATAFPVAWGKEKARPTVFLVGKVKTGDDRSVTTVEIRGFTKDSWSENGISTFEVSTFDVRTDRALLRDLGYSFALAPKVLARGYTARSRDEAALDAPGDDEKPAQKADSANVAGIRFDIFYGDEKQSVRRTKDGDGFALDDIPAGTKLKIGLTRVADGDRKLGVIVKINGLSLYQMDDRDSMQCLKWLFASEDKAKTYSFHGFHMDPDGKEVRPFVVLSNEESSARMASMGSRAGWIDIDVFAPGDEKQEDEQLLVSSRGGSRRPLKADTLAELREGLLKRNNLVMNKEGKTTKRGLIVYEPQPMEGQKLIQDQSIQNPVRLGGISIQYYAADKGE